MESEQDFGEILEEYGIDPSDFEEENQPLDGQFPQYINQDYGQNHTEYSDSDIEIFSSPTPRERRTFPRIIQPESHSSIHAASWLSGTYPPGFEEFEDPQSRAQVAEEEHYYDQIYENDPHGEALYRPHLVSLPDKRSQHQTYQSHISTQRTIRDGSSERSGFSGNFRPRTPVHQHCNNSPNSTRVLLRPVSELPDIYRNVFKFGVFNAVQSTCFETVHKSNENAVISAPTGSGKTVLFELAIIRMIMRGEAENCQMKCVYVAPTKALCSERYRDWSTKFDPLGAKCCELTGDTVQFGKSAWGDAKSAAIIITTTKGEKWDSLTRNWGDFNQVLSSIRLFMVDEVHILNESRGSTLEVVVSRMKSRGTAVRFVMVSATVPNIGDIASWIGCEKSDACPAKFGDEYRPCKLTRHVYGISKPKTANDFSFAAILDYKLYPIILEHSVDKPILIFVSTRKGVLNTADCLMKSYEEAQKKKERLPWKQPARVDRTFQDKHLGELSVFGIGVHHAGLNMEDRRTTEDLFIRKQLRVVVATSTLAVGVNLPAYMVIIKGVKIYQGNAMVEYSDLDIMQMMGRAGRPQFDKEGVSIILCESELENKYVQLARGTTTLESSLHGNLAEHLNSEIGLGTITDVASAKCWLRRERQTWEEGVDDLVMRSIKRLKESDLIEYDEENEQNSSLASTTLGDIMAKLYIRQSTMTSILAIVPGASIREILEAISSAEEFSEMKLRASEKQILNKLRQHEDIRFQPKKVEKTSDKIFLLIQAILGGISLSSPDYKMKDAQPQMEAYLIFRHLPRIAKVTVEVAIAKGIGSQIKHGLELLRCINAKAWEDRPIVLRQLEQIGEKSLKVLAENGIASLSSLRRQDPLRIETLLNRRPPFGLEVLASLSELPEYYLEMREIGVLSNGGKDSVKVDLSIDCGLLSDQRLPSQKKKQKTRDYGMTVVLTLTSDLELVDFRRIHTKALKGGKSFKLTAELTKPSQSIQVYVVSESYAGVTVMKSHKPKLDLTEYPVMDTKPLSSVEYDIQGLEDNSDFWNMTIDEDTVVSTAKKAGETIEGRLKKKKENTVSNNKTATFTGSQADTKRLPNGKFACNHPCKDKTKCRHLCCREGLVAPPAKKSASNKRLAESAPQLTVSNSQGVTQPKVGARKSEVSKVVNPQLDRNQRKNANNSDPTSASQKEQRLSNSGKKPKLARQVPIFDLQLSDLREHKPGSPDASATGEDEELPELYELLSSSRKEPSSETDYSNSELDALIREAPLDIDTQPAQLRKPDPSPQRPKLPPKRPGFSPADSNKDVPSPKRLKRTHSPQKALGDDSVTDSAPRERGSLFFSESDSGNENEDKNDQGAFAFKVDYDSFDILNDQPISRGPDGNFPTDSTREPLLERHSPAILTHSGGLVREDPDEDLDDDLAQLEAWFKSDAVKKE